MIEPASITFRRLCADDMQLLFGWLQQPHVRQWYSRQKLSYPETIAKYEPRTRRGSPVQAFVVLIDGIEVGYIQTYVIASFPDYAAFTGAESDVAGIDLFLGRPSYIHRGFGGLVIRRFVDDIVFASSSIRACVVDPNADNIASIRAFEKVGFRAWKVVTTSAGEAERLLRLDRAEGYSAQPSAQP